jgi:hypothetical protein
VAAHHVYRFCLRYQGTSHLLDAICIISKMKSDICFVCFLGVTFFFSGFSL